MNGSAFERVKTAHFLCCMALTMLPAGQVWGAKPECSDVYEPAKQAIVALVGAGFYEKYITPRSARFFPPSARCIERPEACADYLQRSYCFVTFTFRMPELPFVDEVISCVVDPDGKASDLSGVPPCITSPPECEFPYNEAAARKIAKKAGLEPGIKPWSVDFLWNRDFGYIWGVSNTLHAAKYSAEGNSVHIDANDGRVLGVYGWDSVACPPGGRNYQDFLVRPSINLNTDLVGPDEIRVIQNEADWKEILENEKAQVLSQWQGRRVLLIGALPRPVGCSNHEIHVSKSRISVRLLPPQDMAPPIDRGCAIMLDIGGNAPVRVVPYWNAAR